MADHTPALEPAAPATGPRCVHLRAKTMYIPGLSTGPDGEPSDPPFYWCNRTLRELGPDGESVHVHPCTETARVCHQGPPAC